MGGRDGEVERSITKEVERERVEVEGVSSNGEGNSERYKCLYERQRDRERGRRADDREKVVEVDK